MGLIDSITTLNTLSLDTNIFIYAYQKSSSKSEESLMLLEKIINNEVKAFISVLVFEEFLVKIYQDNLNKDTAQYEDFLTAGGIISVVDVDRQVARKAAQIRAEYPSIRTPDALHLACAIEAGTEVFITADKRLPKKIGKLKIQSLR